MPMHHDTDKLLEAYIEDLRKKGAVGTEVGSAVERAELFDRVRSRRVEEQAALLRLSSQLLRTTLDPQEIVDGVVREAATMLRADACALLLPNLDDRPLLHAAVGLDLATVEASRRGRILPGSAADVAVRDRRPVATPDASVDTIHRVPNSLQRRGFRGLLAVPVLLGERAIGALQIMCFEPREFPEDEVRLLSLMANQAAIAIHNAREYEEKSQEAWHRHALLQVAENLRDVSRVEDVADTVARITPLLAGAEACMIFLTDGFVEDRPESSALRPARAYGLTRDQRAYFESLLLPLEGDSVLADVLELQVPLTIQPGALGPPGLFGDAGLLAVSVVARREALGVMVLAPRPGRGELGPRQVDIATGIASQAGIAFQTAHLSEVAEVKERMERELNMARELQVRLIPDHPPHLPGFEIEGAWHAAREVAGDFYDFIALPGGQLGVLIADVSDKGMPAALFMAVSRSLIRTNAAQTLHPAEALRRANALIAADHDTDMFVTCFYLVLDPVTRRVTYARAGHNYPLWWSAHTGEVRMLESRGIALGVVDEVELDEGEIVLQPGDVLVLYTDGLTEALDAREREFGEERLAALLRANSAASARRLVDTIIDAVEEHAAGQPQFDDLTVVVMKALES